jgi:hypothetical protein
LFKLVPIMKTIASIVTVVVLQRMMLRNEYAPLNNQHIIPIVILNLVCTKSVIQYNLHYSHLKC